MGRARRARRPPEGPGAGLEGGGDLSPPRTLFAFRCSPPNPFALRVVRSAVRTRGRCSGTLTPPGTHPRRGQRPRGATGAQGAGGSAPGLPLPCRGQLSPCPSSEKFGGDVWNAVPSVGSVFTVVSTSEFQFGQYVFGRPPGLTDT